jgi:prolyl-tRNA synthetase
MATGANEDDWHFSGVSVDRDISVSVWADLRTVASGEKCVRCGGDLELWKGIEVGHIFKLGTKYSEAFGAYVQDEEGTSHPVIMGSYGIGVERAMAAVVESSHDDKGIVWPVSVAPFEVVVTVLRVDDPATLSAAQDIYTSLRASGVDVILDDRAERPGVKFADSELVGIPFRVTIGPRGVENGSVEFTRRSGLETVDIGLESVVATAVEAVETGRAAIAGG